MSIRKEEFDKLSPEEKDNVDLFLWEMNVFKGGVMAMEGWWSENNVKPPVSLPNCDNDATAILAPGTSAADCAHKKSKAGAVKVVSLAGAIFHHKDQKCGQQDTLWFYFDKELGFHIAFPDTSNTCFQLHAEASAILITYLNFFLQFLDLIKDNKTT
ncbi:hypothetical protein BT96DRAFT_1080676 [Gymnopus androsaceus JB14]|uniref:Uncharacterized protein n=1 Tax=Gymnopus androsaceus JB14 TaxID=1447944 RepID=A0A6A4I0A6_9AGAR|nr:hypothetical protein BT96DRAFT_1080676 [Gymnopus androsaceus JB14]